MLPATADNIRQRWNQRLYPDAPGSDHAKERWTARLGKQSVRRNAVLAIEVFMGMLRPRNFPAHGKPNPLSFGNSLIRFHSGD